MSHRPAAVLVLFQEVVAERLQGGNTDTTRDLRVEYKYGRKYSYIRIFLYSYMNIPVLMYKYMHIQIKQT
jgi:hypothetical protein